MKSDVENLSETRVKFTVELPFDDLADAVVAAYRKVASQVQVPGFRRGRVPRQVIDQRFGRAVILEEVVNSSVPPAYEEVVRDSGLVPVGEPDVEVTEIADGERITFTAEVDIRPEFELPDYRGLRVEVDTLEVSDEDVTEQLDALRARFGTYRAVPREARPGDVLLLDISATADGEPIEELSQKAISYEVGSEGLVPGLDEAVLGAVAGEERTFEFVPGAGPSHGRPITVGVTVGAVRERDLPEADDDLAMLASEFDTVDELLADIRERLGRARLLERGQQARVRVHDALLEALEIPLPQGVIASQLAEHFADPHGSEIEGEAEHRTQVETDVRKSLKSQFLLDRIADAEDISVGEAELSQWLMMQAPRYRMNPDEFAQTLIRSGQVPSAVAEVRRTKALALVLELAEIFDTDGLPVDLSELDKLLKGDGELEAAEIAEDLEAEADAEADEIAEAVELAVDEARELVLEDEDIAEVAAVAERRD